MLISTNRFAELPPSLRIAHTQSEGLVSVNAGKTCRSFRNCDSDTRSGRHVHATSRSPEEGERRGCNTHVSASRDSEDPR